MNRIRLKWRVFGFLLGFCLLLLLILWLFQIVFLNDFYRHIRISEIRNNAAAIISIVDSEGLPEAVMALSEEGDFFVDIITLDGWSVIRRSRSSSLDDRPNTTLIALALENGGEFYEFSTRPPIRGSRLRPGSDGRQRSNRQGINLRPVESLLYIQIAGDRAVIINAVVSPVYATVTTLRYQLYMISGIMLILAVLLALLIAKRVSKPIEEINHCARHLTKGRYNIWFSVKGFYEIEELSETLNIASAELGKTETLRRELLANVSHDLRTPLALIYSYAEMMHDFPKDITREQSVVIMEETKRLTNLVNDVLDISKLEANMERLNTARINLTESLLQTIERMRELLKNQGYEIDFIYDEVIFIEADETMINRAFYNLLVNAVNYAGSDHIISVAQEISDTHVKILITDNGEGISETDLPFIWDRYYKNSKGRKQAGTGLGLAIVKKIIELHDGKYGVVSKAGKGSTFWFELRKICE